MSRTKESFINIKYSLYSQVIILVLSFISRTVFVSILGNEYLGLNGLFTNVIAVLSLTEMGIGSAITYSLYRPLTDNNKVKITSIMFIFKKAYTFIGIFIFFIGLLLASNLNFFINDIPNIKNIKFIFMLYILTSSISYFFSYKRLLLIADRKKYIDSIYQSLFSIIMNILQILFLVVTNNFIVFLIIKLLFTFLENFIVSLKVNKLYPFLNTTKYEPLSRSDKNEIINNVKATILHKFGGIIVTGTDNIVISKFIGLSIVGIYSNYLLILNALNLLINQVFNSLTSILGNIGVTETRKVNEEVFEIIDFLNFWIYSVVSICLYVLLNPFIILWLNDTFIFPVKIISILILIFYVNGRRNSVISYKSAYGLFSQDKYKPFFEAIINLFFSILLGKIYGIIGVFSGTFISLVFVNIWIEPLVLYKYGFKKKSFEYFKNYIKYLIVTGLVAVITIAITIKMVTYNWPTFLLKAVITFFVSNLSLVIIYNSDSKFKMILFKIINLVKR